WHLPRWRVRPTHGCVSASGPACCPATPVPGTCSPPPPPAPIRYAPPVCSRSASQLMLSRRLHPTGGRDPGSHIFPPAPRKRVRARAKKCPSLRFPILLPEVIRHVLLLLPDYFPADICKCCRVEQWRGSAYGPATPGRFSPFG